MDRRLGGPLPHQLANPTRVHLIPPEFFTLHHAMPCAYAVLAAVSSCYPPVWARLPTRYSPVRRSVARRRFARLACVKHAASVHPEPGSNSLNNGLSRSKILAWLIFYPFTVFKDLIDRSFYDFKRTFEEMCFTVQLSMFVLFSLYLSDFCILSHCFYLVKNFLTFLFSFFQEFLSCFVLVRCNSDIISDSFLFVKNFFNFFIFLSQKLLSYCSRKQLC